MEIERIVLEYFKVLIWPAFSVFAVLFLGIRFKETIEKWIAKHSIESIQTRWGDIIKFVIDEATTALKEDPDIGSEEQARRFSGTVATVIGNALEREGIIFYPGGKTGRMSLNLKSKK